MWRRALSLALLLALVAAPVAIAQPLPPGALITMQNAATVVGNGTALSVGGFKTAALQIATSGGGNTAWRIIFEASLDSSVASTGTWSMVTCYPQGSATGATSITTTTTESGVTSVVDRSMYRCNVAGFRGFRARIATHPASGLTITVKGVALPDGFSIGALTP